MTCAVCDKPLEIARFRDVTAAGETTRYYRAYCPVGEMERGSQRPTPHWCHPAGADPAGEVTA